MSGNMFKPTLRNADRYAIIICFVECFMTCKFICLHSLHGDSGFTEQLMDVSLLRLSSLLQDGNGVLGVGGDDTVRTKWNNMVYK